MSTTDILPQYIVKKRGEVTSCKLLTLYLRHKAQALPEVRADVAQTRAEQRVTVGLAHAASVVAHVELITAFSHDGDPEVELWKRKSFIVSVQQLWI